MASSVKTSEKRGIVQSNRRVWDKEVFQKKAEERIKREEEEGLDGDGKIPRKLKEYDLKQMKPLKARDMEVNLSNNLGKTAVLTPNTPKLNQGKLSYH